MKKLALLLLFIQLHADEINIALAANVSYVMDALTSEFAKSNPDTKVKVTLGGSGKLTAQISNGAPFDIFMSANMKYPQLLFTKGFCVAKPVTYAEGSLALFSKTPKDFIKGIASITSKNIKLIAVANPRTAPYGAATVEALKNANLYNKITSKLVYGESISQTVSYVMTVADMGFIAKSALYSPYMSHYKEGKNWIGVDPKLYTPINQGILLLKRAQKNPDAQAFYSFMLSQRAKKIFKAYGYSVQ